jgi:RNA polymerase sigma-54 factor
MIIQQLTQTQQQKLSPLQIQQIKLLELAGLEIEDRINQELEDNPALEEITDSASELENDDLTDEFDPDTDSATEEDFSLGDYLSEDDIPGYRLQQNYYSDKSSKEDIPYSESESFHDYLLSQFHLKNLSDEKFRTGDYLIGNMDDAGYIRRTPDAISDDLAFQYGLDVSIPEIEEILKIIQQLDPPGVGAGNLQECLLIQLKRKEETKTRNYDIRILEDYFDAFSKRQYDKILRALDISEEELKELIKEIILLNPKPGNAWESNLETKMAQITPDFFVEVSNGELFLSMQENIPELKVSKEYTAMLTEYTSSQKKLTAEKKEAINFVRQKVDSAKWFIDAIKQRNTTLKKTMLAIINIQRNFFLTGEESNLKPMILKDVAELCGYDISTVSRVSNSKYVQTSFGIYSLKYFFSESMTNDEGEEISTREIKAILKNCIEDEDKSKPMTDDSLMKELKSKGYEVARRTVAKYREQLNIPVARLRKEI